MGRGTQVRPVVHDAEPDFPLLLVGNRIDVFNPVREWNPKSLNLDAPSTQKEKSIVEWASALQRATGMEDGRILLTSAGQSFSDVEGRYGLEKLACAVVESLPAAVQNAAARALRVDTEKRALAEKLIWQRSVAAAAVAATPTPDLSQRHRSARVQLRWRFAAHSRALALRPLSAAGRATRGSGKKAFATLSPNGGGERSALASVQWTVRLMEGLVCSSRWLPGALKKSLIFVLPSEPLYIRIRMRRTSAAGTAKTPCSASSSACAETAGQPSLSPAWSA